MQFLIKRQNHHNLISKIHKQLNLLGLMKFVNNPFWVPFVVLVEYLNMWKKHFQYLNFQIIQTHKEYSDQFLFNNSQQ